MEELIKYIDEELEKENYNIALEWGILMVNNARIEKSIKKEIKEVNKYLKDKMKNEGIKIESYTNDKNRFNRIIASNSYDMTLVNSLKKFILLSNRELLLAKKNMNMNNKKKKKKKNIKKIIIYPLTLAIISSGAYYLNKNENFKDKIVYLKNKVVGFVKYGEFDINTPYIEPEDNQNTSFNLVSVNRVQIMNFVSDYKVGNPGKEVEFEDCYVVINNMMYEFDLNLDVVLNYMVNMKKIAEPRLVLAHINSDSSYDMHILRRIVEPLNDMINLINSKDIYNYDTKKEMLYEMYIEWFTNVNDFVFNKKIVTTLDNGSSDFSDYDIDDSYKYNIDNLSPLVKIYIYNIAKSLYTQDVYLDDDIVYSRERKVKLLDTLITDCYKEVKEEFANNSYKK